MTLDSSSRSVADAPADDPTSSSSLAEPDPVGATRDGGRRSGPRSSIDGDERRLRVGVVAPPWLPVPPPAYGGTEAAIDVLCRGLAAAGHEVLLVASGDSTCPVERRSPIPAALGIAATAADAEPVYVARGYELLDDWSPDVVHDHTLAGSAWASAFVGLPTVTTNHGPFDGPLTPVYRRLSRRVPVIAISEHHAREARTTGAMVAAVIHHGVDTDRPWSSTNDGSFAAFLGRMSRDKGIDVAIDVARRAGVPLRIAAKMREPAEVQYFEAEIRPRLGGSVEYVGELGRADQQRFLSEARCLLNPIRWHEPFGMVVIEALAAGTPVVATRRGAMTELVHDGVTGFLADDLSALAEAVLRTGGLDRRACRADAERRFSAAATAGNHAALFRRVLGARRGAAAA